MKDRQHKTSSFIAQSLFVLLFSLASNAASAQAPNAKFKANQLSGCAPLIVNFTDQSTGSPTSWLWDFGNGNTSALQNPSAIYTSPGIYYVTLTATNANGSSSFTGNQYITVFQKPEVDFSASQLAGCFPVRVQFTDLAKAPAGATLTKWQWDFGNGEVSSNQSTINTYKTIGDFPVTLTVTDNNGCATTLTKPKYIHVTDGVTSSFINTLPGICEMPATVSFTNQSKGVGVLSYKWLFDDGGTSEAANPYYTYNKPGYYTVKLVTSSDAGCVDTATLLSPVKIGTNSTFTLQDNTCENAEVSFQNTSSPLPNTVLWNFGNGTSSTDINPLKVYNKPGTFTVELISYYNGCSDTVRKLLTITPKPKADFTSPDLSACIAPHTANFTSTSINAVAWQWDFGDGATSTIENPSHTYTSKGSYDVSLIVTGANGCADTLKKVSYIIVDHPRLQPQVGFPMKGCTPFINTFTAIGLPPTTITSYLWDFGDGSTSALPSPSHTYNKQGTYSVQLIGQFANGCSDTLIIPNAVQVGTKPQALFTANPLVACAATEINFQNASTGPDGMLYEWHFGDGGTSIDVNPNYKYNDTGYFSITLITKNNGCTDTLKKINYVKILPPIARFVSTLDCSDRYSIMFKDQSIGAVSLLWDFGDGSTSSQQNPSHTYSGPGVYRVKLKAFNGGCIHEKESAVKIIINKPDFTSDATVACRNVGVNFAATGIDASTISSYLWNFGDGFYSTSGPSASHSYSTNTNNTVTLQVTDANGCVDIVTKPNMVALDTLKANFEGANVVGCKNNIVTFNDLSVPDAKSPVKSFFWDFGDGINQSFTEGPYRHRYTQPGSYSVKLVVTDAANCKDSVTLSNIVFISSPIVAFASNDTLVCPNTTVNFQNISNGTGLTYLWDFGNGKTSTSTFPSIVYSQSGYYSIKLIATDNLSCKDSIIKPQYIHVSLPTASFAISDSASACTPFKVNFTNTSQSADSIIWNFGDGGTANIQQPSHSYTTAGVYTTSLYAFTKGGCSDTSYRIITVYDTTGMKLTYSTQKNCIPALYQFSINTTNPYKYTWDFGDGNLLNDTLPNESHFYTKVKNYFPKIILKSSGGCLITLLGDTIKPNTIVAGFNADRKIVCEPGSIQFTDQTTATSAIVSYLWDFGDNNTSAASSPVHFYNNYGKYNVKLNVASVTGCTDSIVLSPVVVATNPQVRITGPNAFCENETARHKGQFLQGDTSITKWQWTLADGSSYSGQTTPQTKFTQSGNRSLQLIATSGFGCSDTIQYPIRVHPLPVITLPNEFIINAGESVLLPATYSSGVVSKLWYPSNGLNCRNCSQPVATPPYTMNYKITAIDSNSCTNQITTRVVVLCNKSKLYIPNAFTPNGDGLNDVFMPAGTGFAEVKSMRIFNRWGQLVFEQKNFKADDPTKGWNGTIKGLAPMIDTYTYTIEIECEAGAVSFFKGTLTLIL